MNDWKGSAVDFNYSYTGMVWFRRFSVSLSCFSLFILAGKLYPHARLQCHYWCYCST